MGRMYSSELERGDEGADHWRLWLLGTWRSWRALDARTANMELCGADSSDDKMGISVWTGVTAVLQDELVSLGGADATGELRPREQDRLRPRVLMVRAGRRLVEWAR